jgi:hypothetical protein
MNTPASTGRIVGVRSAQASLPELNVILAAWRSRNPAMACRRGPAYVDAMGRFAGALVAGAFAVLVAVGDGTAGPSFVIRTSSTLMRVGSYRIEKDPTYAGAVTALGPSSSCRLARNPVLGVDRSHAFASWTALGLTIELRTYGSLPRGKTACTAPRVIRVHTVRVIGERWRTARGLSVGDSVARLRVLYPTAKAVAALPGWYARGSWLVTRPVGGYEGIGGLRPSAPVLVAETVGGRVNAFVIVVGAEGD